MEPPKPQKSFAVRHPIWTTILIGVPIVIFISAIGSSGSSNNSYQSPPSPSAQVAGTQTNAQPANLLALKSVRYYRDGAGDVCANGEVENISNQTLSFVQANIQFRDKSGNLVTPGQTYLSVDDLDPSGSATFEDCETDSGNIVLGQTTLSFTGAIGNGISHDAIPYEDDTNSAGTSAAQPASQPPSTARTAAPTITVPTVSSAGATNAAPVVTPPAQPNWNSYQQVAFNVYYENPAAYAGKNIVLLASPDDFLTNGPFLPSSNNGGITNFIEMTDPAESGHPIVDTQIDSQSDYTAIVNALQSISNLPFLMIYGKGAASQSFTMTNGATQYFAIIKAARIDVCSQGIGTVVYGEMPAASDCTSGWQTAFPAGVQSNANAAAPQATAAPSPAPSNPRYFQLNLNGICTNYGNDGTIILTGYPYANGYSIPTNDISMWSGADVAFTVPSDVAAGTYQVTVRGYEQGMGSCPDVNGGNITVQ